MRKAYIILALNLLLAACHNSQKQQIPPLKVKVSEVITDSIYNRISFSGTLEAINSAVIQPRISGYLKKINYLGSKWVNKGDLLFSLEPGSFQSEMYGAQAAVDQSMAELLVSERNFERAVPLVKINAISQSDYDQYKANYKAAKASLTAAKENLKTAQINLSYTQIYAPIAGIASKTKAALGDYVGLNTELSELCVISDIDSVIVSLLVPSSVYFNYSLEPENLLSNISLTLSNGKLYPIKGSYYYTKKDTPTNSSSLAVVVSFANPERLLKAGMFARITANIGTKEPKILVPQKAVSQTQGVNSVWVLSPDNTLELRTLTLGRTHGDMWIVEKGLQPQEKVLVSGQLKVRQGMKVTAETEK